MNNRLDKLKDLDELITSALLGSEETRYDLMELRKAVRFEIRKLTQPVAA